MTVIDVHDLKPLCSFNKVCVQPRATDTIHSIEDGLGKNHLDTHLFYTHCRNFWIEAVKQNFTAGQQLAGNIDYMLYINYYNDRLTCIVYQKQNRETDYFQNGVLFYGTAFKTLC